MRKVASSESLNRIAQQHEPCHECTRLIPPGETYHQTEENSVFCQECTRTGWARWWQASWAELTGDKTLWDIVSLAIIPLVVLAVGFGFSRFETLRQQQMEDRRAAAQAEVETERSREAALQAYLDAMEHLLEEGLTGTEPEDAMRDVARARTLAFLRTLDGDRKAFVVSFLHEAGLIPVQGPLVDLRRADLSGCKLSGIDLTQANLPRVNLGAADLTDTNAPGANLRWTDLTNANLSKANMYAADLFGAKLGGANLTKADLRQAELERANLEGANLEGANLEGARVLDEQLAQAESLEGTILPDGTVHE